MQTLNPHAVALGRLGGLRGGPARAAILAPLMRREIAKKASRVRWGAARMDRLRVDRLFRRRVARKIALRDNLDAGDIEHALFNLTLSPMERLSQCLARSR